MDRSHFTRIEWPARLVAGAVSGLWGSASAALILWGAWMLPVLGLVINGAVPWAGVGTVALLGVIAGAVYGLLRPAPGIRPLTSALGGLALGAVMWVLGALVAIPLILGLPAVPADPRSQWPTLAAFVAYGLATAMAYELAVGRMARRHQDRHGDHAETRQQRRARRHGAAAAWSPLAITLTLTGLAAVTAVLLLRGAHTTDPAALAVRPGFRAEVVAKGFTFPTSLAWGPEGVLYVGESGYSYGPKESVARVVAVEVGEAAGRGGAGGGDAALASLVEVASGFEGPLNGLAYRDGLLYVSHRGKVTVLHPDDGAQNERRDLVTGLPSWGDHHNNELAFGADGYLYLGQGTVTNAGVVGSDNFVYAWADRRPWLADIPSREWRLAGHNYSDVDLRTANPVDRVNTGAFAPFGVTRSPDETIPSQTPASGTILRIDPATGAMTVYADGLRNPYGLAVGPGGELYASNLGYDDRGVRAVRQSPDWVLRIEQGAWYGWPDYAGDVPLTDPRFESRRGVDRRPLLSDPPPVAAPLATLEPHVNPMKLAVSPGGAWGDAGGIYVAAFGDVDPLTEELPAPVPTGVLRIDPADGSVEWFLRNQAGGRAARWGAGLKRAIAVLFAPDGSAMYLLDFGQIDTTDLAPNPIPGTGVLWRIVPDEGGP